MEADVVINLAKLKTHTQMMLTLGVKNLFGCIVGLKKPEWHMRTGVDRQMFGRLIVSIFEAVGPAYTIMDGILAMEGQGPGRSGTPRELGLLMGGKNAHAVDHVACLQVGLDPDTLETHRNAREMGVYDGSVHINGDLKILDDFQFPELGSLTMGPDYLGRFMRRFFIQQPVADNKTCKLCGECWKYCPAKAISYTDRGITFNTDTCIRCYCCLEVCPHAAIRAKKPIAGRVVAWLTKNR
jgi:ferredoxin